MRDSANSEMEDDSGLDADRAELTGVLSKRRNQNFETALSVNCCNQHERLFSEKGLSLDNRNDKAMSLLTTTAAEEAESAFSDEEHRQCLSTSNAP